MTKIIEGSPIILGLAGKAGAGKTSVAEQIVPKGALETTKNGIKWDHIFFALPLYELASIRKNTKGERETSRKLYAIHNVLYEIYGSSPLGNIPDYDDFVRLVKEINALAIEPDGVKPRRFLQSAGDICRNFDPECFAKWGVAKSKKIYREMLRGLEDPSEATIGVIISDVRYPNEAQNILDQPNGFVICFDASDETLNARLMKRDGKPMSAEAAEHSSEKQMDIIKEMASGVLNTDGLDIEQQTQITSDYINNLITY